MLSAFLFVLCGADSHLLYFPALKKFCLVCFRSIWPLVSFVFHFFATFYFLFYL